MRALVLPVVASVWWACAEVEVGDRETIPKPNVVIIVADDLGWADVGYHGSRIRTPSIDRLAREGVELDRFYVTPVCVPTRAGLMTGRYPNRMGLDYAALGDVVAENQGLPADEETLPEVLAKGGYEYRMAVGKWHLGSAASFHPMEHGFTGFYGMIGGTINYFTHRHPRRPRRGPDWHRDRAPSHDEGYATELLGREAVRFIESVPRDRPFLLYLAFNAPHTPYDAKPDDVSKYLEDPWWRETHAGPTGREQLKFAAAVTAMDEQIGGVLQALESRGVAQDTLVWFLSDNGGEESRSNHPLKGAKRSNYEGGIRVPAAIRWPRRIEGGRKVDALIAYVDVLPTVAAAAGNALEPAGPFDGIDVLPIVAGEAPPPARSIYPDRRTVVTQRWKLVAGEVYDLSSDPLETTDLAARRSDVAENLEADLAHFLSLTRRLPGRPSQGSTLQPGPPRRPREPARMPFQATRVLHGIETD